MAAVSIQEEFHRRLIAALIAKKASKKQGFLLIGRIRYSVKWEDDGVPEYDAAISTALNDAMTAS